MPSREHELEPNDIASLAHRTITRQPTLDKTGRAIVDLNAGHYVVEVRGRIKNPVNYELALTFADQPVEGSTPATSNAVEIEVVENELPISTYADFPQELNAVIRLNNSLDEALTLNLGARSSNDCCEVIFESAKVVINASDQTEVPIALRIRRDWIIQSDISDIPVCNRRSRFTAS